jgi:hypothetical protein
MKGLRTSLQNSRSGCEISPFSCTDAGAILVLMSAETRAKTGRANMSHHVTPEKIMELGLGFWADTMVVGIK